MTRTAACLAGALVFALAGCAGRHGGMHMMQTSHEKPCKSRDCDISVIVKDCKIWVNEPTFYVGEGNSAIVWNLDANDKQYSFSSDGTRPGVFIKNPRDGNFTPEATGNNKKYKLKNNRLGKAGDSIPYTYGLWIYDETNTKMCPQKDPVIVNEF